MQKLNFKFLVTISFITLYSFNLLGSTSVDSLKILLNNKKGEEKFEVYEQLANYYINNNSDSSLYFLSELKEEMTMQEWRQAFLQRSFQIPAIGEGRVQLLLQSLFQ